MAVSEDRGIEYWFSPSDNLGSTNSIRLLEDIAANNAGK